MTHSSWQQRVGGLFSVALVLALAGLLVSSGNTTALTTVIVALIGGLLLVAMLPRVSEFSVGPAGVAGKLAQLADDVQRTREQVENQEATVRKQGEQLERQQELINELVKYSMSASIFRHLCGIALLKTYTYNHGEADSREMYFLRDNGLIKPTSDGFLDFNQAMHGRNIVDHAEPTEIGWVCVKLRKSEIPPEMLENSENLRVSPSTF